MSKAYLCVEFDDTETPPQAVGVRVYSESANTLTRRRGTSYRGLREFTGEDFHEAAESARAYLFSDEFAKDFPQYKTLALHASLLEGIQFKESPMSLRERLASIEHDRWAGWQKYLHSKCIKNEDGSLTIPADSVQHWERQIATPYADLSEREKHSDRVEVDKYLPLVKQEYALPPQLFDLLALLECMGVAFESGIAEACLHAQDKVYELQSDKVPQDLGDLLAVIHRDGGHYMEEHGLEKACKDAEQVVHHLRTELDVLGESHDILVKSEDPW